MSTFARYPSLLRRTVLITGGATGTGATLVEQFADQRARVGFVDIDATAQCARRRTSSSMPDGCQPAAPLPQFPIAPDRVHNPETFA